MENIINDFNELDLNYLSTFNGQIEANLRFQEQVISGRSQEIKVRRLNILKQIFRESRGLNYQRLLAQSYRLQSQQNLLDLQLNRVREKILSRKFVSWSQNFWRYFDVVNMKDNDFTTEVIQHQTRFYIGRCATSLWYRKGVTGIGTYTHCP